jgi:hypothetical protein
MGRLARQPDRKSRLINIVLLVQQLHYIRIDDLLFERSWRMRTVLIGFLLASVVGLMAAGLPSTTEQLLEQYYLIHKSLASDTTQGISAAATRMEKIGREAAGKEMSIKAQLTALSTAAAKLQTTDLKFARSGFGDLSDRLIACLQGAKAAKNPPYQFYCSMVKKNWLQADKEIRNPYYGKSMLTCGELVQAKASDGHHGSSALLPR